MTVTYSGSAAAPVDGRLVSSIDIQPLSTTQWRVCDRSLPENDVRSLLGYIEQTDFGVDALTLTDGLRWFSFATLEDAAAHFEGIADRGGRYLS